MAEGAGRDLVLSKNSVPIAGVTSVSLKSSVDGIDITNRDHNGYRTFLGSAASPKYAGSSLTIEVEGIETDGVLYGIHVNPASSKYLEDLSFLAVNQSAGTDTLTGDFLMTSYEYKGTHDGAIEFSATFESSGAWAVA